VKVARLLLIVAGILLPVLAAAQSPVPSVTITSPEPGLTIAADSVAIGAAYAAPDESVVQQVELLIDGNVIEAYTVDPPQASGSVSFIWGALHFNDGAHTIAVRATDSEGRVGESEIRVLLGRNQLAPPVRVSNPLTGGAVSGTVSVDVDAGQRSLIKYVIFLVDDVFKAMSNVSPFTYLWDTTRYLNGLHRLQVKVYFKAGAESLSPAVEVRVDNPGGATTLRAPEAGAGPTPEPIAAPARAAQSELPAPMRTESLSAPPLAIQVADAVVAIPGTAPYVSPAGDLVTPPAPSPMVAPAPPAARPAPAPAQVALLPSPAPEAPVPVAAAPAAPSPALAEVAAVAVEPAPAGTHVAMLPEKPEEQPVAAKPVPAPAPAENVYLVQPNDCLWAIASAHNTTVATLAALNDLPESGIIHPGQQLRLPSAQIYCDGKPLEADAAPIVANGRAIVPLRAVVESAGGTVTWQPTDRQAGASLNNHQVTVTIGSTVATLDGSAVTLAGPPTLSGNRTLVPLRFLGEAFDLVLEYQAGVIRIATVR